MAVLQQGPDQSGLAVVDVARGPDDPIVPARHVPSIAPARSVGRFGPSYARPGRRRSCVGESRLLLDNVRVQSVAVPEPSALALLGIASFLGVARAWSLRRSQGRHY